MAQRQNSKKSNQSNKNKNDAKRRMLVDASKHEETRVAIAQGGKLQDFEVESLVRRQIKGNIYLAKVTRVEPSLQAAFVNYGGNRHGFLPFSEIHPDYYRIPVADRERLMAEQEELEKAAAEEAARIAEEEDRKAEEEEAKEKAAQEGEEAKAEEENNIEEIDDEEEIVDVGAEAETVEASSDDNDDAETAEEAEDKGDEETAADDADAENTESEASDEDNNDDTDDDQKQKSRRRGRGRHRRGRGGRKYSSARSRSDRVSDDDDDLTSVEPFWKRIRRAYKIQEVIKRGQIMLIQVGKEERGNKGAAVTSYITLPGRYCVLMSNTPQSGGVSRKISNYKDRKRMREILKDLNVPQGMSVILRTAGTTRTKAEIKRDLDYLMRLWNNARDLTLKSTAPALINEEGSLVKRAVRDMYNKDIDEVVVAGDQGYKTAKDMMKMLMPSHVKKVKEYKNATPLFIKERLEQQIEDMHSPQVELKSGGYLVINPTEALVSIDVNSGRATKERNIEDTALQTNIEAAQEIARQLRLRDLGGLVVVDFIDMDKRSYNGKVERAMREALAGDRARIQVGRISSFGLMEMSRQRLNPSLTEAHFEPCPHCHGMGIVKTVDTMALTVLRAIEEQALQQKHADVTVTVANEVALYLFNNHRRAISDLEDRYNLSIAIEVGTVEGERGFDLASKRKPKPQMDDDDQFDEVSSQDASDTDASETVEGDDKPAKKKRSRRAPKKEKAEGEAPAEKDQDSEKIEEVTESEEKPKAKKRGRPAKKKKIEIEEVTDTAEPETESKEAPAPTNDNGGDGDQAAEENTAARDAETINEAPKSKKKGWWNKITS